MAIKDILKVNRKTFVNPSAWLDYETVKTETKGVVEITKNVFTPDKTPPRKETFDQALKRLNMNAEELENAKLNFLSFAAFFVLAALMLVGFGIYLLIDKFFLGFMLSLAMSAILFAQAFRFHFYYFQLKHRKLGCTFEEWRSGRVNNEDSSA